MGNDAVAKAPTLDEQISVFKGFSTQDGEVAKSDTSAKAISAAQGANEPADKPKTAAERLAALSGDKPAAPAKAGGVEGEREDEENGGEEGGEDEEEPEEEPSPKPKAKADPNKRIAQAVGRQRAAERQRDAAEARYAALEARMARLEGAGLTQGRQPANNAPSDAPPDPSDYQYGELDTKFIADTARYETLKTLAAEQNRRAQEQNNQRASAAQAEAAEKFRAFEAEGLARYPDFDEVVTESAKRNEWSLSPILASLLVDSEHGPDIAYHLATNRKEAQRVHEMTPAQQARWFGQRTAALSSETPDARSVAARVSQAPEVPRRAARGNGSRQQVSPDTADFAAFERLANQ